MASVAFQRAETGRRRAAAAGEPGRRLPPPPRPALLDLSVVLAGLGLGASVALALTAETWAGLRAPGGIAIVLGNLTGLVGSYLALLMVLLVGRIPAVERVLGQDGLLRWHRRLAPWPISLIVAHAVLITYGYAEAARAGFLHQLGSFISSYSGMLIAVVGFGVLVAVAVLSIYSVRRRLRRETWWAIHLGMYLALALAFVHEIALGPSFVEHPLTVAVWSAAWAATAGVVLLYRFGLPLWRSLRYRLEVREVRSEAEGVISIICRGRHLESLAVSGGQFFEWRFLTKGLWWQAHPYTLSARPRPPYLRLTVKAAGDHSAALAALRPGTRVAIEGPYGSFSSRGRRHTKVALLAGGIGITAVRALLEDLKQDSQPVVIWRVASEAAAPLADEVRHLVSQLGGAFHLLAGSRRDHPLHRMLRLVPDLHSRDVYVCGPQSFVADTAGLLRRQGVGESSLHYEAYEL